MTLHFLATPGPRQAETPTRPGPTTTRTRSTVRYELASEDGLTTDEDGPKMIMERLSGFVGGSTAVSATGTEEG